MSSVAFGPLHASATTVRPPARPVTQGVQTWFKDASAAGKTDGTVLDASWLNSIVANLRYLMTQADINPGNDQEADTYVYDAIAALIQAALNSNGPIVSVHTDGTLRGSGEADDPLGLSQLILDQLAQIQVLFTRIADEVLRATAAEARLSERIAILEAGLAPRATTSQYGFARLGAMAVTDPPVEGGDPTVWTLI